MTNRRRVVVTGIGLVSSLGIGTEANWAGIKAGQSGVDTRPFFLPLHTLPPFREESQRRGESLPITDRLAAAGINLPTFPAMTDADVLRVATTIRQAQQSATLNRKKRAA